jgi:hypothetical protein
MQNAHRPVGRRASPEAHSLGVTYTDIGEEREQDVVASHSLKMEQPFSAKCALNLHASGSAKTSRN